MISQTLLLVGAFACLVAAILPPCLPMLGPEFCPGATVASAPEPEHSLLAVTYPTQLSQEKDDLVLYAGKESESSSFRHSSRHCYAVHGQATKEVLTDSVERMLEYYDIDNHSSYPVSFRSIKNKTPQDSLIFRFLPEDPYTRKHDIIIVGAHMDSTVTMPGLQPDPSNHSFWDNLVAPGADDNASSLSMLLEVIWAMIPLFGMKQVQNEVQFHFWAAEEVGLLGSKAVFETFRNESRSVKAVLNFDMVGWSGGHKAGSPKISVMQDHTHENLTEFAKKLIGAYSDAEAGDAECRYPCSDHASAFDNGFPSAALLESGMLINNKREQYPYIHTSNDTIDKVDVDYMIEFAKVAAAFAVELAYVNFSMLS